ncbi:hypothetical protein [Paenibacillus sp. 453mf]|uniref:hypothetical protein n=1 Tax=Paenibacillus sp. 453mf TaxID=1761874 RepID=UPI0008EEB881|nr:hypothetical protein [Paenibacillus sp. 453mf]SFS76169.1 hypothetical protein SAMN04488601_10343 [Paenibacillus sp. 453mf]
MEKMTQLLEVSYVRDHQTGNFFVTLLRQDYRTGRQIVVLPGAFFHILPQVNHLSISNLIDITVTQAIDLGFIIDQEPVEAIA